MHSSFLTVLAVVVSSSLAYPSNIYPLRHRQASTSRHTFTKDIAPLTATEFGSIVDVEITIGGQDFLVLVDLGSADTWVVETGYQCINGSNNAVLPQSDCIYSNKTYHPSPTFSKIPDQNFGVFYGAGIASGIMAYENITIAGINLPKQEIGIVKSATNRGGGIDSGLLGLAYPALTSAHPGERQNYDNTTFLYNRIPYTPLVWNMAALGHIKSFFSLAIERIPLEELTGPGGLLAFGEIAPVPHSTVWASSPVVTLPQIPLNVTGNMTQFAYWALDIQSVTYGPGNGSPTEARKHGVSTAAKCPPSNSNVTKYTTKFSAVLDNGNPLTFLPSSLAEAVNAAFSPPAVTPGAGDYVFLVDCKATAPVFGVEIGSQVFWHDPRDMIYYAGDGVCYSAIARAEDVSLSGISSPFLGMQFFKNVLAVFDFGVHEMRFAAR